MPRILQAECSDGLVLVEDVGAETLYDKASSDWRTLTPYYEDACRSIEKIRAIPLELCGELNPPLDAALLWRELQQTWDLFLEPNHLTGFRSGAIRFRAALERLCTVLGEDRMVTSHRDFMPRNLIPLADAPLSVVLDHQDLRPGPEFYDVASLLNDSLFPPAELERRLLRPFVSNRDDQIRYHRTAAQRTLKAVGTYAAFARRGARRHDRLIPLTLGRAFEHLSRVPETEALVADLGTAWRRISAHDR